MASLEEFESILNDVGRGDRRAFHQLFDLTAARVFGLCKAILDDDDWADEVLEGAYIDIWQNAISWQDSGLTPVTWVLSMVREYAISARRQASDDGTPDPVELQRITPSQSVASAGEGETPLLRKALGWLPKDRQDALLLSYFSGIRYSELATKFRVPYATVRNWQQRSLSRLHGDLTGRRPSQDVVLAGEYVLDVIPVPEHEEFEERLQKEPELQSAVAAWTEDFIVLTDSLADRLPQPDLLARLEKVLFPEQTKPIVGKVRFFQTVIWVAIAGLVAWGATSYWPQLDLADLLGETSEPQQSIAQIDAPDPIEVLPTTGDLFAVFRPSTNQVHFGGDVSVLASAPNKTAFLDFGDNTEWISLGSWPELPPHVLAVPPELSSIALGAEIVILGGQGSDQEVLRIAFQ